MSSNIDAAVAQQLCTVLKHDRVYPDGRWLVTNRETGEATLLAELPVLMYRQTGGNGSKCLSGDRGGLRDDFYLLEVFAEGRDECSAVRDALLEAFKGPPDPVHPGRWATWGSPKSPCRVKWAEIDDPEAGAEFPESEMHLLFRFVRMVLTVQWQAE